MGLLLWVCRCWFVVVGFLLLHFVVDLLLGVFSCWFVVGLLCEWFPRKVEVC